MRNMKVKELMAEEPTLVKPDESLKEAAAKMTEIDCGMLPVGTPEKVEGVITDRDIVIRAVSQGKDISEETVREYMTDDVFACNEDDQLEDAAAKMRSHNVSRLVVRNHQGVVTGVLSFGSILRGQADANEIANIVKHATGSRAA